MKSNALAGAQKNGRKECRDRKCADSDDLSTCAVKAEPGELLALVKQAESLISKEQGGFDSVQVEGRLLRLPSSGKAVIIGDLHGDLESLQYIIKEQRLDERIRKDLRVIFLGDYGDRGPASPEVDYVVLKLKEMSPENVILMRGNHEGPIDLLPAPFDLDRQLNQKYGPNAGTEIYAELRTLFDLLYCAVIVDKQYVIIHGGFPSKLSLIDDIAYAYRRHPKENLLEEMLWNDPRDGMTGVQSSMRGVGKYFGKDVTDRMLKILGVDMLIRGHEFCKKGHKLNHEGKILTLYSCHMSSNRAAYLPIDFSEKMNNGKQLERYVRNF